MKKLLLIIIEGLVIAAMGVTHAAPVFAATTSIGASPSVISNQLLVRGASFTEDIVVSRSDAAEDIEVTIEVFPEELRSWTTIENGGKYSMLRGSQRVTVPVTFMVPAQAEFKKYEGYIRVTVEKKSNGQVSVLPGVRIDVTLVVSDKKIEGFKVLFVKMLQSVYGQPYTASLRLNNIGNVDITPEVVILKITDVNAKPLRTIQTTNLKALKPFESTEYPITFTDSNPLPVGEYLGEITVYYKGGLIYQDTISFAIVAPSAADEDGTSAATFLKSNLLLVLIAVIMILMLVGIIGILFVLLKRDKKTSQEKT